MASLQMKGYLGAKLQLEVCGFSLLCTDISISIHIEHAEPFEKRNGAFFRILQTASKEP